MINDRLFGEIDADLNHFNALHGGTDSDVTSDYFLWDSFNELLPLSNFSVSLIH